jgi:hypothetical protein
MKALASTFALIVAAQCVAWPASAQYCSDEMTTTAGRASALNAALMKVDAHVRRIEMVPPDQAAYIKAEHEAAMSLGSRERYRLVTSNRFYRAFKVREEFQVFRENLLAAQKAPRAADQAIFASVSLARQADLADALRDYIDFDRARSSPVYVASAELVQQIWFDMTFSKGRILHAMQCAIRQLREP